MKLFVLELNCVFFFIPQRLLADVIYRWSTRVRSAVAVLKTKYTLFRPEKIYLKWRLVFAHLCIKPKHRGAAVHQEIVFLCLGIPIILSKTIIILVIECCSSSEYINLEIVIFKRLRKKFINNRFWHTSENIWWS